MELLQKNPFNNDEVTIKVLTSKTTSSCRGTGCFSPALQHMALLFYSPFPSEDKVCYFNITSSKATGSKLHPNHNQAVTILQRHISLSSNPTSFVRRMTRKLIFNSPRLTQYQCYT